MLRPLKFLEMGQYDYFYEVQLSPLGELTVHQGSYQSQTSRYEQLDPAEIQWLTKMLTQLPAPQQFPQPLGAVGFTCTLVVGQDEWRWWVGEGSNTAVSALVQWLKSL